MHIGYEDFHLLASLNHYEILQTGIDLSRDSSELLHIQYQHGRHPMQDLFQIDDAYEELKSGLYNSKCIKKWHLLGYQDAL